MGYHPDVAFDRVTFRDGQLLTARDLGDDQRREAHLWALHTRHLHETQGIALGFALGLIDNDRIQVKPGFAVDEWGRAIVLTEKIVIPVPRTAGSWVLTARHQEDAAFRARSDLAEVCLGGGLDPRYERPTFAWRRQAEVRFGAEVPLVQVVVANGVVQGDLDLRVRRYTRPLVRPYIDQGETEAALTNWQVWREGQENMGLEVVVDTSAADFTKSPVYFATLLGDFSNRPDEDSPLFEPNPWGPAMAPLFADDTLGFICREEPDSFTYRLLRSTTLSLSLPEDFTPQRARARNWRIRWTGFQPVTGCEPELSFVLAYTLAGVAVPDQLST